MAKLAFLFPGQGAQYPGMCADIYQAYVEAREVFNEASEVLKQDIAALSFYSDAETLGMTENTQPCMLTCEVAILRVLETWGVMPVAAAGFSLGEWAELVAADVLSFENAIKLIQVRAKAMQEAVLPGKGGMAVMLSKDVALVQSLCERAAGYVVPSNFNCPGQITVAGDMNGIHSILAIAQAEGVAAQRLAVSIPSHCQLMQPAAAILSQVMMDIPFSEARYPLYMNATGLPTTDGSAIKGLIIDQLTCPVQFEQTMLNMLSVGINRFLEIGPGKVLSGFVKKTAKSATVESVAYRVSDIRTLTETLDALGDLEHKEP